jgi:hypothetical protein
MLIENGLTEVLIPRTVERQNAIGEVIATFKPEPTEHVTVGTSFVVPSLNTMSLESETWE